MGCASRFDTTSFPLNTYTCDEAFFLIKDK